MQESILVNTSRKQENTEMEYLFKIFRYDPLEDEHPYFQDFVFERDFLSEPPEDIQFAHYLSIDKKNDTENHDQEQRENRQGGRHQSPVAQGHRGAEQGEHQHGERAGKAVHGDRSDCLGLFMGIACDIERFNEIPTRQAGHHVVEEHADKIELKGSSVADLYPV